MMRILARCSRKRRRMRAYLVQPQLSVQADLSPAAWLHTAQQNQRSRHQSPGKTLVTLQWLQVWPLNDSHRGRRRAFGVAMMLSQEAATLKRLQTWNMHTALGNATEAK